MTFRHVLLAVFLLINAPFAVADTPYPVTGAPGDFVAPISPPVGTGQIPAGAGQTAMVPAPYQQASLPPERIDAGPVVSEPALPATPYYDGRTDSPVDDRCDDIRVPFRTTMAVSELQGPWRHRAWYTRLDAFH